MNILRNIYIDTPSKQKKLLASEGAVLKPQGDMFTNVQLIQL